MPLGFPLNMASGHPFQGSEGHALLFHSGSDRPEVLRSLFSSWGWDGGTDVFKEILSKHEEAIREHFLMVEVGTGDGRQVSSPLQ